MQTRRYQAFKHPEAKYLSLIQTKKKKKMDWQETQKLLDKIATTIIKDFRDYVSLHGVKRYREFGQALKWNFCYH